MINWQLILSSYLSSKDYFLEDINLLYAYYDDYYIGECIETTCKTQMEVWNSKELIEGKETIKFGFTSDLYENILKRQEKDYGFKLSLQNETISELFSSDYPHQQISSILFAYWYGLNEKQIQILKNNRKGYDYLKVLNYFIRFPNSVKYDKQDTSFPYNINVHLDDNTTISTTYENGILLSKDKKIKFAILP